MPTQIMPAIKVHRATIDPKSVNGSPVRDNWGEYEEITDQIDLSSMVLIQRAGGAFHRLSIKTKPDNTADPTEQAEGQPENPIFGADDLIAVESIRIKPDGSEDDPVLMFEGFVAARGFNIFTIGEGRFEDREEVECLSAPVRSERDIQFQVYGQTHTDPTDQGNAQLLAYGGPAPDYGRTVFNPGGRGNRDTLYTASGADGIWPGDGNTFPLFTWPDATGSGYWTVGQAITYLCAVYNETEEWFLNPPLELLDATGIYAADYARMNDRVPDSFTVDGSSFVEALAEILDAGRFRFDFRPFWNGDQPQHQLEIWPLERGRNDRWIALQKYGEPMNPVYGDDIENEDGTNITGIRYLRDLDGIQNAPTGLGDVDRYSATFDLIADWASADLPAPNIEEDTILDRYVTDGKEFLSGGYRKVFRKWSTDMEGRIGTDGYGSVRATPVLELSTLFGYQNIARPRAFGRLPVQTVLSIDEMMLLPIVEWRTTTSDTDWRPLENAGIRFHTENDSLSIAAKDLRNIVHPVSGATFWDAAVAKAYSGGTLDLRVTSQIAGDRRVISAQARSSLSETLFEQGRIFDHIAQWKKRQNASDIVSTVPTPTEADETTSFDAYMERIRDANAPGPGSGLVSLLTWDNYYLIGDRILGIRGGRDLSFEHGTTGRYPNIVQIEYNFGAFSVQIALGDLRRASTR